ncbi:MAG TPA: LysR family transcriptional regulator [Gemmataceae bacterium]|nr:LysR family transcriptional regulator [Gemmataceae bacterium]
MIDASLFPALMSLVTVARSGSVGAAARLHHRTSSAISQQIRRLETHFGVKLTERAGRGVRLTPAGETALPALLELVEEAESVFGRLAEVSGRPITTLRVAVSDYLGKALLVPVVRGLLDRGAPLRFEIVTTHSREGIRLVGRGEVEFAVVTSLESARGLDEQHLFDQPFAWVGPRRGRHRRAPLVERLHREPLLRLAAESQGRRLLDEFLERERVRPVSTIDVPSVSLMLSYVSGGLGIGLVPALALSDVTPGRVVIERARVPALPVKLVGRASARRGPVASRFAAQIAAEGRRAGERLARRRLPGARPAEPRPPNGR